MANVWYEDADRGTENTRGNWRVCWRNDRRNPADTKEPRTKGSAMVRTARARDELMVKVRRAIDVDGRYVHCAPAEIQIANLELAAAAWLRHRAARGAAPSSIIQEASSWARLGRDIRDVLRIAKDASIPVTVLTREMMTRLLTKWQVANFGEWHRYRLACSLYRVWKWAADEPEKWPGVPTPPRDSSALLPLAPIRGRAPDAPTPAECDVICRRAAATSTPDLAKIVATLRLTGLRIGQVMNMKVGDVDRVRGLITVTTGKTRREKADMRVIPAHPSLLVLLASRLDGRPGGEFVFPPLRAASKRRMVDDQVVKALWEAATAAGEVRREVWDPPHRRVCRPNHAFRAGYLAALTVAGVPEAVRFALVGHEPGTTEGRSYSAPTMADMRDAVNRLPPIEWKEPPPEVAHAPLLSMIRGGVA